MNVGVFLRLSQDSQLLNLKAAGHQGQPGQSLAIYYRIDFSHDTVRQVLLVHFTNESSRLSQSPKGAQ